MIHIQVFETNSEYNTFTTNNTDLESGVLYYIKEDNTAHYYTNNIDGIPKVYNFSSDATDTRIVLNDDVFGWTASSAEANQAGTFAGPALTNSYSLPVTYSSSNTDIATVNQSGEVNAISNGTATITAAFAGDEQYYSKTVSYELTVAIPQQRNLTDQEFGWTHNVASFTVTEFGPFTENPLINIYNLPVTYETNPEFVSIDENGNITTIKNGSTWVWVRFAGNEQYYPKEVWFNLDIVVPQDLTNNEFSIDTNSVTITDPNNIILPTLTNVYDLPVTYGSSDTSVATVDNNGQVTVVGNGNATIIISFAGNETYKSKTLTYDIHVAIPQELTDAEFGWPMTVYNYDSSTDNFVLLNNTHNLPATYTVSDENVLVYDSEAMVGFIQGRHDGTATITATFAGNEQYKPKTAVLTVNVDVQFNIDDADLSWSSNSAEATETGSFNGPTLTNRLNLPVTYSSSDTSVATINQSGSITVVANGTTTITASFAGDDYYNAKTVTYALSVSIPVDVPAGALKWTYNEANVTEAGSYTGNPLINTLNLPVTFSATDTSVATVDQYGNVTVIGNGWTYIRAEFDGNSQYKRTGRAYTLTVAIPGELPASDFEWSASSATVTTESSAELPTLTNNHNLSITYTSSDTSVATVDNTGKITVVGNGTTTISAVFAGNSEYNPKTISYELTVAIPQELPTNEFGWSASSATVTTESSAELPTLINSHELSVAYESSDTNVATINDIGKVTVIGNGTTTISATFSGNETYKAKTVTYTLTVAMPVDVPAGALDWSNGGADVKVYHENGGVVTTPTLINTLNLPVTYSSENSNIATVDSNGQVTVVGDGYTYIYAIFAGNEQYNTYAIRYKLIADTSEHIITSTSNAPVMTVMKNKNFAANSDFMTENEAKAVTTLNNCMRGNTNITSFNEFQYFTGVTALSNREFYNCSNLEYLILPDSLTTIYGEQIFDGSKLITINIPKGVSYMNTNFNCSSLESITVDNQNTKYYTQDGVLYERGNYNKIYLLRYPEGKTGATFNIPQGVNSFGIYAIRNTQFSSIVLPSTISNLSATGCLASDNLTSVTVNFTTPISGADNISNRQNATLYVPAGCKETFKAANYWKDFKQILEPIRNLTDAELGWSASSATVTTESPAELPTLNNTFNLTVAYSSSDTSVATIDQSGSITVVANGTTTITASFAGNVEYNAKNVTYTLEVAIPVELTNQEFAWSRAAATAESAGIYYEQDTPTLINTHSLSVTYSSSNTSVATVDANGQVTIIADGTTTITANFAGNATYKPKTAGYLLTVQITRQDVSDSDFYWNPATVVISSSGDATRPVFVNNLNLPIRYVSSAESVATIDQSGNITIVGNGTTNLQAIFSGNQSYNAKTRTAMFVVNIPEPQVTKVITSQSNPAVMSVMHNAGLAANQDYMTDTEAAAVTNSQLEGLFAENTDITTFNEFQYFTGITSLDPKYVPATDISEPLNNGVFQDSTLTEITLPPNLTEIGEAAFCNCTSLETIGMPIVNGVTVYPPIDTIGNLAFAQCESLSNIEDIVYGDGTTTKTFVGVSQFEGCNIAYSPDLSLVTDLGDGSTFANCPNMTGVQFSEDSSLTTIPESFMYGMDKVKEIYIPDNIVTIEDTAFCADDAMLGGSGNCALETITIGARVETIGSGNFRNTPNLKSVTFAGSNLKEFDGTTFGKPDNGTWTVYVLYTFLDTFLGYNTSMNLNIDPSRINGYGPQPIITMTNDAALMNAINANHNIVHESNQYFTNEEAENTTDVQFVGTFSNNTNITQFDQFKYFTGITTIASKTVSGTTTGGFEGCTNLASIVLPSDIHSFENKAFANCSSLTNFDISNLTLSEVTGIGTSAFAGSAIPNAAEIIGGCTGISYLGDSSFSNLKGTQDNPVVIVPNNITTIGSGVFAITDLQTVQVDGTWTQVPVNPWLEEIYIGPNINEIKVDAFKNQIKLSRVVIYKNTPPIINTNIWNDVKNTVKIYVPNVSAYTSSSSWSAVKDRIYDISAWKDADGYTDSFDPSDFWPNVHTP